VRARVVFVVLLVLHVSCCMFRVACFVLHVSCCMFRVACCRNHMEVVRRVGEVVGL
jgi:hypothetical protein